MAGYYTPHDNVFTRNLITITKPSHHNLREKLNLQNVRWATTKYTSKNIPITQLTNDSYKASQGTTGIVPEEGHSAESDGIAFCEHQFRGYRDDVNVILLFTDGRYDRGVNPFKYIKLIEREYEALEVIPISFVPNPSKVARKPFYKRLVSKYGLKIFHYDEPGLNDKIFAIYLHILSVLSNACDLSLSKYL